MINITRKEDCTGCGACGDICGHKAISFQQDCEGFYYPIVNRGVCTECGLCEKVCPLISTDDCHVNQPYLPVVIGAMHENEDTRLKSTSGGIFSALAENAYAEKIYVGGAMYTDDYYVKHFISNNQEDLLRLRGSKHIQSNMTGFFKEVRALLKKGEKVLVCGAPCQMAGLRSFVGHDCENLITVDFICLGINSPKVFHKHLDALKKEFGGNIVSIQAKNKDTGWRSLAYKITFDNGEIYHKPGKDDAFTQGFIGTKCNIRPACFECKFKGFPRGSDISLGDFWGIENVDTTIDDNKGTSIVLLNTQKGIDYFEQIKKTLVWKEYSVQDILSGNQALMKSAVASNVDRSCYYADIDRMPFDAFKKKYGVRKSWKSLFSKLHRIFKLLNNSPSLLFRLCSVNIGRQNTQCKMRAGCYMTPTKYTILDIHKTAKIKLEGHLILGYKRVKGSRIETALLLEENSRFELSKGNVSVFYGADIQVFKNASLVFRGRAILNKNVQIICMDSITIGDGCLISRDVVIRDNDGGHRILAEEYRVTAPVVIENNVWIGHGAMIMKGVTIGAGAIIGAGAWVTTSVKPGAVVLGDPARMVQKNVSWIP